MYSVLIWCLYFGNDHQRQDSEHINPLTELTLCVHAVRTLQVTQHPGTRYHASNYSHHAVLYVLRTSHSLKASHPSGIPYAATYILGVSSGQYGHRWALVSLSDWTAKWVSTHGAVFLNHGLLRLTLTCLWLLASCSPYPKVFFSCPPPHQFAVRSYLLRLTKWLESNAYDLIWC